MWEFAHWQEGSFALIDLYQAKLGKVLETLRESIPNEWVSKESVQAVSTKAIFPGNQKSQFNRYFKYNHTYFSNMALFGEVLLNSLKITWLS